MDGFPPPPADRQIMNRLKRVSLLLLINVLVLVPLIYGFEFFLRWRDPKRQLPFDGIVNGKRITWGRAVTNNRFGFREREFETPKPKNVLRIMVIGDSLTWGPGLAAEERYSYLLEKRLKEAYPNRSFEVLNFGAEAASTIEERAVLSKYKDIVQPDLIVIGFCVNDPQPRQENYSIEREQFENHSRRLFTSVKYRSQQFGLPALGQLVADAIHGLAEKTNKIPQTDVALARVYVPTSTDWRDFVLALNEIKRMSDQMKLPSPIFAALNQSARVGSDYDHPSQFLSTILRLTRQGEEAAGAAGFKTIDYEKEIPLELPTDATGLNILDSHPSAKLNQLYAKKLFAAVVNDLGLN